MSQRSANNKQRAAGAMMLGLLLCLAVQSQEIQFGEARGAGPKGHVTYAPEVAEVAAGKPATVELRFHVDEGFHVNSNKPLSDLLIPTVLKLEAANGVKVLEEAYPKGSAFRLTIGDGETLDVYQGEFRIRLRVVVPKGQTMLKGGLRYQACDHAACFPPRTLPVSLLVTGK